MKWILASLIAFVVMTTTTIAYAVDPYMYDGKVYINGLDDPNYGDIIYVYGDAWSITVDINGVEFGPFNSANRIEVRVMLHKGDDKMYYPDVINVSSANQPKFVVFGDDGDDIIQTGEAADTVHGGYGEDTIWTFGSVDFIYGDGNNDDMKSGTGADSVDGGSGTNNKLDQGGTPDAYRWLIHTLTNPST